MNITALFTSFLARFPVGAAILYAGLVLVFTITAWTTVVDILERRDAVAATADILSQLEGRKPAAPRNAGSGEASPVTGSPLLEGATVTIGGANLLQRVAGAVAQRGGNILYTQVDLQGTQSKDGFVSVTVSCEAVLGLRSLQVHLGVEDVAAALRDRAGRSEERRVGKECS